MDWSSVVTGLVVGVVMLVGQYFIDPLRERKRLKLQEEWMAKKAAFSYAVEMMDRQLAAAGWEGESVPEGYKPFGSAPSRVEINSANAMLVLSADSIEIPIKFVAFFAGNSYPASRGEFLIMLRKELFGRNSGIKAEKVDWVF